MIFKGKQISSTTKRGGPIYANGGRKSLEGGRGWNNTVTAGKTCDYINLCVAL
jgi:hypothetical protein